MYKSTVNAEPQGVYTTASCTASVDISCNWIAVNLSKKKFQSLKLQVIKTSGDVKFIYV